MKTPGGVKAAAKNLRNAKKGAKKNAGQEVPANSLPPNSGVAPNALKNFESPKQNKSPVAQEQAKASPADQALIKNRLRFMPNDAEIDRASRIFCDANTAYPECTGLAFRLLEAKHPGEAAETWKCVEEFASKMRQAYERLNEKMNKENSSND